MSSITLNGDTSGSVQLTVPAVAGSSVITVPAGTGTVAVQGVSTNIVTGTSQATTSGTTITITGIPAWAKRVTLMLQGVGTNGTSSLSAKIGSGSLASSGYISQYGYVAANASANGNNATSGFILNLQQSANSLTSGIVTFCLFGSNTWVQGGTVANTSATVNSSSVSGGYITLSGTLDRVAITTVNGTDAFNAGSINILYE